jgi:hypothetical protein
MTDTIIPPFQNQSPTSNANWSAQPELFQHMLNVAQGNFGVSAVQVDWSGQMTAADAPYANAGSCGSVNPFTGKMVLGLEPGRLPYLLKPCGGYNGVPPVGNVYGSGVLAIPCCQCQRVQSTEFVNNGNPYLPNQPLTALAPAAGLGSAGATKGMLKHGQYYNDTILGIVIKGIAPLVSTSPLGAPFAGQTTTNGLPTPVAGTAYQPQMKYVVEFYTYFLPPFLGSSVERSYDAAGDAGTDIL